jgi:type II secretory pathway predicted ATPase ExeA
MKARRQFGLYTYPLPKDAKGKTFFEKGPGYCRFERAFAHLVEEPGLGILTSDPGVGKTAAVRNLCGKLPQPDYQITYICDTNIPSIDLYRTLASELGVRPSFRRADLWVDLKKSLIHMVDERGNHPVIVLDEAQNLSDGFLMDLSGFLNFSFDSRELFTIWLVGLPILSRRLRQLQHAALRTRISAEIRLEPLDRETFLVALDHGFKAAGATTKVVNDQAAEMLYRASRGTFRVASRLVRTSLRFAQEKGQAFVDETIVQLAIEELGEP